MSLSDKEKAQLQSKRIKRLKYKATGLYLYHPATDSWIPAQCDAEGRLVIDPSDLDTRYYTQTAADVLFEELLKLDGSRVMTGDLDLAGNDLLTTNFSLSERDISFLRIMNRAKSLMRGLMVGIMRADWYQTTNADSYLRTDTITGKGEISFQGYSGLAWTECARLGTSGINDPTFHIPRAGDITLLAGKLLDMSASITMLKVQTGAGEPNIQNSYWRIKDEGGNYRYIKIYDALA